MELAINGRGRLDKLELTIKNNMAAFYEIGTALREIRDSRLYKDVLGYNTFEDYCRERWDIGRDYSYKQIASAQVVENLQNVDHGIQIPTSERQVRPLTKLSPPLQIEAWTKTIETAPDGRVTAKHISDVVWSYMEKPEKQQSQAAIWRNVEKRMASLCEYMMEKCEVPATIKDELKNQVERHMGIFQTFYDEMEGE